MPTSNLASCAARGVRGFLALLAVSAIFVPPGTAEDSPAPATLPGTAPLAWEDALDLRMMDGLHRFVDRKIAQSTAGRARFWRRDASSAEAYARSVDPNRDRLKKILGLVDQRVRPQMTQSAEVAEEETRQYRPAADRPTYSVYPVRWTVLDGVGGEGLLLEPAGKAVAQVVVLPDADELPEAWAGLTKGESRGGAFVARLIAAGVRVVIPALVDRSERWSGNPEVGWTNQPHREWIYRQAYQMGRHIIGYEVQRALAVVDWFATQSSRCQSGAKTGIAGYGEGGLIAFYAAAVDPRIDACLASGYFQAREATWREPLYRNVWGLLREFGDAEVASLIAPRGLVVEYSVPPEISGPPAAGEGRKRVGAVGAIARPDFDAVQAEFQRIGELVPQGLQRRHLMPGKGRSGGEAMSAEGLAAFLDLLGSQMPRTTASPMKHGNQHPQDRQRRQVQELENHVQRLVRTSDRARDRFLLAAAGAQYDAAQVRWTTEVRLPPRAWEPLAKSLRPFRDVLWEEVLGKFDDRPLPPAAKTRLAAQTDRYVGYDVVLDVFPDVFAWGLLMLPRNLKPGERRPVVVCQHGRNGVPADTLKPGPYNSFAARLADEGFIVFAPHNPYRGEDRYRLLSRKANGVKASLFSFILAQHEQLLRWLASRAEVDARRVAFYGLSYGGETAVRVPPLLDGYCLSICSGDFNDWTRKVASTDSRYSFMFTVEWEMPYFNLGNTFGYAEMAYLMIPRPFMVERGHFDGVAPDEWVAYEYAKVRRMYDLVGLGDRTRIEFFNGGHAIHGRETFEFLRKHLKAEATER